ALTAVPSVLKVFMALFLLGPYDAGRQPVVARRGGSGKLPERHRSDASNIFAARRSGVENPSVKRRYTDASASRACVRRRTRRRRPARLIAARSSQASAP